MNVFKKILAWIKGRGLTIIKAVAKAILSKAKSIAEDKELLALALTAIKSAASGGLRGNEAWDKARSEFVSALQAAGVALGNCAIDTILQSTYAAWKDTQEGSTGIEE